MLLTQDSDEVDIAGLNGVYSAVVPGNDVRSEIVRNVYEGERTAYLLKSDMDVYTDK